MPLTLFAKIIIVVIDNLLDLLDGLAVRSIARVPSQIDHDEGLVGGHGDLEEADHIFCEKIPREVDVSHAMIRVTNDRTDCLSCLLKKERREGGRQRKVSGTETE
jgi:hypothetical protein